MKAGRRTAGPRWRPLRLTTSLTAAYAADSGERVGRRSPAYLPVPVRITTTKEVLMSRHTAIQWCDSTVNPTMGCEGCELWNPTRRSCYAGVLHQRFGGHSPGYAPAFEQVTRFPGRMAEAAHWRDLRGTVRPDKPWLSGLPRGIFISDMSDALSSSVPFD